MPTSKSKTSRAPSIGITLGEPSGIGPEVAAKALKNRSLRRGARFTLIGNEKLFKKYFLCRPPNCTFLSTGSLTASQIRPGRPNRATAQASLDYIDLGIQLLKNKNITALVTAPICKETIHKIIPRFQGHTEYLADAFHIKTPGMMFISPGMRTILVTRHIPVSQVPRAITKANVFEMIRLTHRALRKVFDIRRPRIAVCGLNPHAGEGGTMGKEELTKIIPAIKKARRLGIPTQGPLPADTLFSVDLGRKYDCVVAMYHDQGLVPIKTLYLSRLVNLTVGLPFIRTSPAHGTAFDIAGKNKADPSSMIEAIRLAVDLSQ